MKATEAILDLLRTYGSTGSSVRDIAETGALFGFSENCIRVNLSRLVSRKLVELIRRGHYRLVESNSAVSDFAETWRLGEHRVTHWTKNTWLCVHSLKSNPETKWALTNHGFKELSAALWVRPSNLNITLDELHKKLSSIGLSKTAILIDQAELRTTEQNQWVEQFDLKKLRKQYEEMTSLLSSSLSRLDQLSSDDAKRETFTLGGKAINLIAKDPLIPSEYMPNHYRQNLWKVLIQYDLVGRKIWATSYKQTPDTLLTAQSLITQPLS